MAGLLTPTERGLFCPAGDFYIDPWRPVDFAVITHAHSDHARPGSKHYLTVDRGADVLRVRLGDALNLQTLPFGVPVNRNGVSISFHPAGHVLGSAQVRLEHHGEVWVVSGDYKLEPDPTCDPFEPVPCHTFVTESTFGLPIYHWPPPAEIFSEINAWWRDNQTRQRTSILFGYGLGKAQRLLAGLDPSLGPLFAHGAVQRFLPVYAAAGIQLPPVHFASDENVRAAEGRGLVLAPPTADTSPWLRKFGDVSTAFASGLMQVRGHQRHRALDRGFVLSDHADWPGLIKTIRQTGAEKVWVTHGHTDTMVRWLRENGWAAEVIRTEFKNESLVVDETISNSNSPAP